MSEAKAEARKAARADLYGELYNPDDFDTVVDAYEAALESAGLVLVPREPTEAMLEAGWFIISCRHPDQGAMPRGTEGDAYRAMIAAAEPK